jgi:tetratricopeptide (TPR) repeat protein
MRKIVLVFFAVMAISATQAQDAFNVQLEVYKTSLKYYDLQSAITSLYTAMAIKPERKDLKDSLALIYFSGERYFQANIIAEEIYKDNPKRLDMLEMAAISKQSLGASKEALADYENLYKQKPDLYSLYQIATLQYQLKRYGESVISCDQIIANAESEKLEASIAMKGGSQKVPLRAAAHNVKGIIAMDLNQPEVAKLQFETALKLFPDFALAQGNLAALAQNKQAAAPCT